MRIFIYKGYQKKTEYPPKNTIGAKIDNTVFTTFYKIGNAW